MKLYKREIIHIDNDIVIAICHKREIAAEWLIINMLMLESFIGIKF